jgi:predicted lipoprotein with Yx(FWY)xxD motif
MAKLAVIVLIFFALIGCQGACTGVSLAGISLTVTDFDTGGNLCDLNIMLVDDDYIEEKRVTDFCNSTTPPIPYELAFEREGVYQIIISKEGYQTWEVEDFVVDRDFCHVITRSLEIELVKL